MVISYREHVVTDGYTQLCYAKQCKKRKDHSNKKIGVYTVDRLGGYITGGKEGGGVDFTGAR